MTTGRGARVYLLVAGIGLACFLAASVMALYYRSQATGFERKWRQLAALYRASQAAGESRNAIQDEVGGIEEPIPEEVLPPNVPSAQAVAASSPARVETNSVPRGAEDRGSASRRGGDWLSGFRTNDPARYEAMQKRREEGRQQAERAYAGATNYFLYRDTRNMSEVDKEEFLRMLALMQQTRGVFQQMQAGLPPDERRVAMSTVRSNLVALTPLLDQERDREMFDLAVSMGHNEAEAERMVAYVRQISSNTSLRVIFPDLPRRGGRFDGPPGTRQ